jgi:hypothetical protein
VNHEYDRDADQVRDVGDIELRLKVPAAHAYICSPDEQNRKALPLQQESDGVRMLVPRLHVYSVIVLERGKAGPN